MNRATLLALIVLVAGTQAANAEVKIITPNKDSCVVWTTAMDNADTTILLL
jgi:hypothetical protein